MGEFSKWKGALLRDTDWDAIVDHAFEKPFSYIIRKNGSKFEVIYGNASDQAGKIFGTPNTDAEVVIQELFNNLEVGDSVFFKSAEYPITNGLTLGGIGNILGAKNLTLKFQSGNDETVALDGARLTTSQDIDLLTLETNTQNIRIIGGGFKTDLASHTKNLVKNLGTRNSFEYCKFRNGAVGLYLDGLLSKVLFSMFQEQTEKGIHKVDYYQQIVGNRIKINDPLGIGLYITYGNWDTGITQNMIWSSTNSGSIGVEINAPNQWIRLCNNKIMDFDVNFKVTNGKVVGALSNIIEGALTYNIQVVTVEEFCDLKAIEVNLERDNEIGFRIEGGTVLIQSCSVAKIGNPVGTKSYESSGTPTVYQRGCYSYDGLLEAL